MSEKRLLRYWFVLGLLGICLGLVLFRYASLAARPQARRSAASVEIERGAILDRTGRVLAIDTALYNIAVWKPETSADKFDAEASRLSSVVGIPARDLVEKYRNNSADFFYLRKRVGAQMARAIQTARTGEDGKPTKAFEGILVERVEGRLYPEQRLASHLLGFVGDGNRGLEGLEGKYDDELAPDLKPGSAGEQPQGNQLVLTIDSAMQFSLEEIARKTMKENQAEAVILLAGDARTGEILSYVAMPDFNPNSYYDSPQDTWYDWPSVYSYEPGSVFKVFTLASDLDLGGINRNTTFTCDGAYHKTTPSGEEIRIKCLHVHGPVNLEKILEYSCNSGAGYAADSVQSVDFYEKLVSFGFGSKTGLGLSGESSGFLRGPETWSLRSKPTIGMGQEILVTGVQMFQAATAIANKGLLLKPIVVRKILSPKGELVFENEPQTVRRVVSEDTAATILGAMETVAGSTGTGWRAKVKDVDMAVKTGTAQMIDKDTKRYSETDYIASTIAIFPADEPRIILYLAIVKPKGSVYYGGQIAAPVVRDAAEAILSLTDLPRGDSPSIEAPAQVTIPRLAPLELGETMPDLSGLPKRLLLPLLERKDLKVKLSGEGYVEKQKPAPGSPLPPGSTIELELK